MHVNSWSVMVSFWIKWWCHFKNVNSTVYLTQNELKWPGIGPDRKGLATNEIQKIWNTPYRLLNPKTNPSKFENLNLCTWVSQRIKSGFRISPRLDMSSNRGKPGWIPLVEQNWKEMNVIVCYWMISNKAPWWIESDVNTWCLLPKIRWLSKKNFQIMNSKDIFKKYLKVRKRDF